MKRKQISRSDFERSLSAAFGTPSIIAELNDRVDEESAFRACRELIEAYLTDPDDVAWSDVQMALDTACTAFGTTFEELAEQID